MFYIVKNYLAEEIEARFLEGIEGLPVRAYRHTGHLYAKEFGTVCAQICSSMQWRGTQRLLPSMLLRFLGSIAPLSPWRKVNLASFSYIGGELLELRLRRLFSSLTMTTSPLLLTLSSMARRDGSFLLPTPQKAGRKKRGSRSVWGHFLLPPPPYAFSFLKSPLRHWSNHPSGASLGGTKTPPEGGSQMGTHRCSSGTKTRGTAPSEDGTHSSSHVPIVHIAFITHLRFTYIPPFKTFSF